MPKRGMRSTMSTQRDNHQCRCAQFIPQQLLESAATAGTAGDGAQLKTPWWAEVLEFCGGGEKNGAPPPCHAMQSKTETAGQNLAIDECEPKVPDSISFQPCQPTKAMRHRTLVFLTGYLLWYTARCGMNRLFLQLR